MNKRKQLVKKANALSPDELLMDLRRMIEAARQRVAATVNAELTLLYWRVGARIRADILQSKRAEYGEQIVSTLSRQLVTDYGRGFSDKNLFRMIRFAEYFPDDQIVATLSQQLSWSHFIEILVVKDELARQFYAELCRIERWTVRTLHRKINSMLFERTAISRKPAQVIEQELDALRETDRLTPDLIFRDPYVLDFLGLTGAYNERDVEEAVLREIERFLLELGNHFAFVARQKRMVIDGKDFHLDLLFFHRALQRLVALELKMGEFEAAHKGQMELYLRWLDKYERLPQEGEPLGLILCAEAGAEQVELLQLEQGSIRIAQYLTELPPRRLLEAKLREAILLAQKRLLPKEDAEATSA